MAGKSATDPLRRQPRTYVRADENRDCQLAAAMEVHTRLLYA